LTVAMFICILNTNTDMLYIITSNPWVVKLSWIANAYSHPVLLAGDLDK